MQFRWVHNLLILLAVSGTYLTCEAGSVPRFAFAVNSFNNTISQFVVDGEAGRLIPNGLASIGQFPNAIAVHPSNKYVFAIAQPAAQLHVYFLDSTTGQLHETDNSPVDTKVVSPFSLALGQNGRFVYVAGRLSDNIMGFEFNAQTAELTPIESMPIATGGRRARQIVVSPDGRFLYSVNVYSDTVSGFQIEQNSGALIPVKGSPVSVGKAPVDVMVDMADIPEGITQAPYNLRMHPSGKFLFVCNWMSASVSVFKVNPTSGQLTLVDGSPFIADPHPYDLIVSPDGKYLYTAHWAMNSIVSFKIAPDSGKLTRLQPERVDTLGQGPVDLWFDPSHNELYVSHYLSHNIAGYRYDAEDGSLHLTNSTPSRFGPRALDFSYGETAVRYSSDYLFGVSAVNKSLFAYKISDQSGELHPQANIALSAVPVALAYDKVNRLVYVATNHPDQIQVFSLQNGTSFESQTPTPITVKETPSDIAVGPNGLIAYITSAEKDRMLVFERHPVTGEIKEWPESPRTTGSYPTEVKIDPVGRFAFVLNEKSNTISSYRFRTGLWPLIDQIAMTTEFGNKNTQLTNMTTDPLGNFLFATDGNNDEVLVYWINTTSGVFDPANQSHFKVGAKPVDMVFHPNGKRAYVVNAKSATIETYSIDHLFGRLEKKLQTLKTAKTPRNLQLDASGRFAYLFYQASNKISMYTIDPVSGQLTHQKDLHNDGVIKDAVVDITMQ